MRKIIQNLIGRARFLAKWPETPRFVLKPSDVKVKFPPWRCDEADVSSALALRQSRDIMGIGSGLPQHSD